MYVCQYCVLQILFLTFPNINTVSLICFIFVEVEMGFFWSYFLRKSENSASILLIIILQVNEKSFNLKEGI